MNLFLSMSVFVEIVELGSLHKAATKLRISPTMVGKHLKGLEQYLKIQLLKRTTRHIALTSAGSKYYQHCKTVLDLVYEGEATLKNDQLMPIGQVTLCAPEILGKYRILPFLLDYLDKFPQASVDLSLSDRLIDMMRDDIDIAIRIGDPPDSADIIAKPLTRYELVACASPDYLKKYGRPIVPNDLVNHHTISLNKTVLTTWQGADFAKNVMSSRLTSDSSSVIKQGALNGMGIVIQAKIFLEEAIENNLLVPLLEEYPLPTRAVNALYLRKKYQSAKINFMVDALQQAFPPL